MGQFKSLKQIFSKFVGQFDLEGQGHKFQNSPSTLDNQYTARLKVKFPQFKSCIHKVSHKFF